jgi:hypothetical protein
MWMKIKENVYIQENRLFPHLSQVCNHRIGIITTIAFYSLITSPGARFRLFSRSMRLCTVVLCSLRLETGTHWEYQSFWTLQDQPLSHWVGPV